MLSPQHMVFINLGISLFLVFSLVLFKYFFPKRKINLLALLIIISLLPCISIFRNGTYESGVLSENVYILNSFYQNIIQGNSIPIWNSSAYAGYGVAMHLFLYPLPFYFSTVFHALGLSLLTSIKLVLASSFVFSGIGMYLWIKREFSELPAFVAALFYLFAPFHLIELHFRATAGDTMAFTFVPFVFLFLKKNIEKSKLEYIFIAGISYSLLILSHVAIALLVSPLIFFYIFASCRGIKKGSKKYFFSSTLSLALGLLFSAFYLIPTLSEGKYLNNLNTIQTGDFKKIWDYIYSPTFFGFLFQGHHGETHLIIGYLQIATVLATIFLIFKNKLKTNVKRLSSVFIVMFFVYMIASQSITKPIWRFPPLKYVLDSWKILTPVAIITSFLAAVSTDQFLKLKKDFKFLFIFKTKDVLIILICFFVIFSTILNWGNRKMIPLNFNQIENNWNAIPDKQTLRLVWTVWVNPRNSWPYQIPKKSLEIVKGGAEVIQIRKTVVRHTYVVNVKSKTIFKENTMYFPGWTVKVDDKPYQFSYTTSPYSGLITFELSPGLHKVEIEFRETKDRKIGILISLFSLVITIGLLWIKSVRERIKN